MRKMHRTSTCEIIVNDKATPSSRIEASSTPEHSIRTSSSKQVCTKSSLTFGMKLDGITSFPLRSMVLDSSPSNSFALFGRWKTGFIFDFSEKNICFLGKLLPVLALLKYPFYPLFILDNGMNLISKSLTVLTRPNYWSFSHLHIYFGGTSFLQVFGL